ncbi:MAG: hypothetical protein U0K83_02620 [Bacteroidales bacterium]|jgi:hypothetical protein|nr:hypothetical protein [Bacteroidales bacterium]
MKKYILFLAFAIAFLANNNLQAQRIEEACEIIGTSIKDNSYKEFTIDGSGFLSYMWSGKNNSETNLSIDLIQITISKEISQTGYKVWINCIDGVNCITEKGTIGKNDTYYGEYNKTYLPANNESDMNAIYYQMEYLLQLANEIR